MSGDTKPVPYMCITCGCKWRCNDDGTWSLYDEKQIPCSECDNREMKVEPVQ